MGLRRAPGFRAIGGLCLAVLLLVPLVLSGHHHPCAAASAGCAACVVVHHAPAAAAPTCAGAALAARSLPVEALPACAPAIGHPFLRAGRSPPAGTSHPTV